MAEIEIQVPAMGEGIVEASVTRLLKNIGDFVEIDEPIIEIATDKVDTEILSTHPGKIEKLLFKEGEVAPVGATIVILAVEGEVKMVTEKVVASEINEEEELVLKKNSQAIINGKEDDVLYSSKTPNGKILSPLVRSIAQKENISIQEIENIQGTGAGQRITKEDVLQYISKDKSLSTKPQTSKTKGQNKGFEIIEMDRMRKLIAEHMVESKKTSAHVTSFVEVDVTDIVNWRNLVKEGFFKKYGEKITYTPIFIEAVTQAIKEYPLINSSVEGSKIILKNDINIGMATALPNGNLIVPVIKNANELSLLGITKKVNDLANRARSNKLKPDEIQGGTFTITNVGTFGNITGTPIINQPEVAILAVGTIKKKPAVIETPQGDTIGIRHIMIMSMSYDHRVIDGILGGSFLKKVADLLESFDKTRSF